MRICLSLNHSVLLSSPMLIFSPISELGDRVAVGARLGALVLVLRLECGEHCLLCIL